MQLGASFSTEGPGLSARNRCTRVLFPFIMGIIASKNTRTPMPPSQWVKLRQYKRLIGKASTFCTTLAPVVVKA